MGCSSVGGDAHLPPPVEQGLEPAVDRGMMKTKVQIAEGGEMEQWDGAVWRGVGSASPCEFGGPDDAAGDLGRAQVGGDAGSGRRREQVECVTAASPAPLATVSPAQVLGQCDPEPAQGGQAAVARTVASPGRYPLGPPLPPPRRGAGVPSRGFPRGGCFVSAIRAG